MDDSPSYLRVHRSVLSCAARQILRVLRARSPALSTKSMFGEHIARDLSCGQGGQTFFVKEKDPTILIYQAKLAQEFCAGGVKDRRDVIACLYDNPIHQRRGVLQGHMPVWFGVLVD